MARYICIHGHFYQPPRENPWLEAIELQDSAYPYHDWNERITAECYEQNAASRILSEDGEIERIINNYARISFNFGPTLLSWMEEKAPDVYAAILEADRRSAERFDGHGSALAQVYNHMILPLADVRDMQTQIRWGIRDFEHRFGRAPEGMWLSETAADVDTLDQLARAGIRFTILAPGQAQRVCEIEAFESASQVSDVDWVDVSGGRVDPTQPYRVRLHEGRTIDVFFYDGPVSQAVAFENLLTSGDLFLGRLLGVYPTGKSDRLVHIATDGETYGHHHRHGDMALAFALDRLERGEGEAELINYAAYLQQFPPRQYAEIVSPSSWSCAHGVERWRSDCGCHTGGAPGWNQKWRKPLREALDWLRDELRLVFENEGRFLLGDAWKARDEYIDVILDRSTANVDRFLERHANKALSPQDATRALMLLEMQRHAQLMYTSCGWFFNDLGGIETVQVLRYAARALQLAERLGAGSLEESFLRRLAQAQSNVATTGDGRQIYKRAVRPAMVDLAKVAAHYAAVTLFTAEDEEPSIYAYDVQRLEHHQYRNGRSHLATGRLRVTSRVTRESAELAYGLLHIGEHNMSGGVAEASTLTDDIETITDSVREPFNQADLPEVLRLLDQHFGGMTYSLRSLFHDEQRTVVDHILHETLEDTEELSRRLYERHGPLVRYLASLSYPIPQPVRAAAAFVLNGQLREVCSQEPLDTGRVRELLAEADRVNVELDIEGVGYELQGMLTRATDPWIESPRRLQELTKVENLVSSIVELPFAIDFSRLQNHVWAARRNHLSAMQESADTGDERATAWLLHFRRLAEALHVKI